MYQGASPFGNGSKGQIGAYRGGGWYTKNSREKRCHERASAHAGQANEQADGQAGQNVSGVKVGKHGCCCSVECFYKDLKCMMARL